MNALSPTIKELKAYFEMLSTNHAMIHHSSNEQHFIRLDNDELLTAANSKLRYPLVMMDHYSANFVGDRDNLMKKRMVVILFLQKVADKFNYEEVERAYDDMEQVADDFTAQIDADKWTPKYKSLLKDFTPVSVTYEIVTNRGIGLFGIMATYPIGTAYCSQRDDTHWNA